MPAIVMNSKELAAAIRADLKRRVQHIKEVKGRTPCLATILVGDDPASATYVKMKGKACDDIGLKSERIHLDAHITTEKLTGLIDSLNERADVQGILLQHPVPKHIDERRAFDAIALGKDVDGVTTHGFGRLAMGAPCFPACTPAGIIALMDHFQVPMAGQHAVVVGRSPILGKPMAALLLNRDATVTVCHSKTKGLAGLVRQADIVVAAVGKAKFITGEMVRPGAWVLDAGYNAGNVGDVDYDTIQHIASGITPVPGGVGPMTITLLLKHTVMAAEMALGVEPVPGR